MPRFRWDLKNDIALASEVATHRPLKPVGWDEIACTLNTSFSTDDKPVGLKGRGCKERLDLLLKKYKAEDTKALKRCTCACSVYICMRIGGMCAHVCVCVHVYSAQVWY